jgi:4-amino-4-deoxy-L-arabinose transferase-like glycosyltransferase
MTSKLLAQDRDPDALSRIRGKAPWPNLLRPPLSVVSMAGAFRVFGISDMSAVMWSTLFYLLTVLLIFLTFDKVFGREAALLSATIFALSKCGLVYARSGLTESSAMFFILLSYAFFVLTTSIEGGLLAGMALGLCAISRPVAALWLVIYVAYTAYIVRAEEGSHARRILRAVLLTVGFVLPLLLTRFVLHWDSGHRLGLVALSLGIPNGSAALESIQSPLRFLVQHHRVFLFKIVHELGRVVVYLFQTGDVTFFSAISILGLFVPFPELKQKLARNVTVLLFACTAVSLAFFYEGDSVVGPLRYLDVFVPLLLPFGVVVAMLMCERLNIPKYGAWTLVAIYLVGSGFQAIRDPFAQTARANIQMFKEIGDLVSDTEMIAASPASDGPSLVWYGDRKCILWNGKLDALFSSGAVQDGVKWYFGRDQEVVPSRFAERKRWSCGFVLYRITE